ncbi:MAG: ABC transporter substrate-binding protein, partial [Acidimicrobiales bacterium]
ETFTEWTFQIDPAAGVSPAHIAGALAPLVDRPGSGFAAGRAAAVLTAGMTSVSADDGAGTVTVTLDRPNAGLPWILSGLQYSIVGPAGAPTGDYEIASDDSNGLILQRKPSRAAGGTRTGPRSAEVQITWTGNGSDALEVLDRGSVDAAVGDASAIGERRDAADRESPAMPTAATRFYVMNVRSSTLADPAVRLAVLSATSAQGLVAIGFNQPVAGLDGLVAPSLAGFDPDGDCGRPCRGDPALAAETVAGLSSAGLKVSYTGDDQEALASAIVDQLVSVGFDAKRIMLPPSELASVIVGGQTDLFAFGWVAPATSIDAVVPPLLRVDSAANIARIESDRVARLLDDAATTADDEQRWAIMSEAHRLAMAEALIVPIAGSVSMLIIAPEVRGLQVRADGTIDLDSSS